MKRIKKIEKASQYYGKLTDVNEKRIRAMKFYTALSMGGATLMSFLAAYNTINIGDASFGQIATSALLPLFSGFSGICINGAVNEAVKSEKKIQETNEVRHLITNGTEEEQRAFLQSKYPGLYDSIIYNYEKTHGKGMNR